MKKVVLVIVTLLIGSIVFATGLNFEFGAGLTVGDSSLLYAGLATSAIFDKTLLNVQPCDLSVKVLIGYNTVTFGYGCVVKTTFKSPEKLKEFHSTMSIGLNLKVNKFLSVLGSFTVNTREELGMSIILLFNLGIYIYSY